MGGGVMRTAAKVAGAGALRGLAADHHPLSSSARRAASIRTSVSPMEEVKLVASTPEASVTKSYSEMDDWVFAGGDGVSADPMPRLVFGGVPTLEEAEEATSELSAALEKAYNSPPSEGSDSVVDRSLASLSLSNTQLLESPAIGLPAPAAMAFRFLSESPKAKNVVASVACDPNVWHAVLHNREFQDYLVSQRACLSVPGVNLEADSVSCDANVFNQSSKDKSAQESTESVNEDFFQKIKSALMGMINTFSEYFKNLFGGNASDKAASSDANGGFAIHEDAMKLFGVAVLVVSLIVLKRAV